MLIPDFLSFIILDAEEIEICRVISKSDIPTDLYEYDVSTIIPCMIKFDDLKSLNNGFCVKLYK